MKGVEKAVRFDHEDSNSDDLYYDEDGISCCDEDSLLYYEDPDEDDPFEWEKVVSLIVTCICILDHYLVGRNCRGYCRAYRGERFLLLTRIVRKAHGKPIEHRR